FDLYGPDDASCSGAAVLHSVVTVNGNGDYHAASFAPTAVGTYRWVARYSGDDSNAAPAAACCCTGQSATPGKKTQAASFTSPHPNATVNGATYTVAATATSGLTVSFALTAGSSGVCTLSGSTVSFVGVGTCEVQASQAGNAEFTAAPGVSQSFAVIKTT